MEILKYFFWAIGAITALDILAGVMWRIGKFFFHRINGSLEKAFIKCERSEKEKLFENILNEEQRLYLNPIEMSENFISSMKESDLNRRIKECLGQIRFMRIMRYLVKPLYFIPLTVTIAFFASRQFPYYWAIGFLGFVVIGLYLRIQEQDRLNRRLEVFIRKAFENSELKKYAPWDEAVIHPHEY